MSQAKCVHRLRSPKLSLENLSKNVLDCSCPVKGRIFEAAMKIQDEIKEGKSFPFGKTISLQYGDPQALGQIPLTFPREVLSLCINPTLIAKANIEQFFEEDAIERAKKYLSTSVGLLGAYSNSQGLQVVREEIAEFISKRDGFGSDLKNIFVTNGASDSVKLILQCLIRKDSKDGILTPIPQYPLYSALLTLFRGQFVPYSLNEDNWSISAEKLAQIIESEREERGTIIRAICVINPGNPTGSILSENDIRSIIELAVEENLVVIADEVYQENIYSKDHKFTSFKKIACEMGFLVESGDTRLQLVSLHSISKGFTGECGLRGGYMELHGFDEDVKAQIYKLASINLCSNTVGQVMVGLMVNPPKVGDKSYGKYCAERNDMLSSLNRRSQALYSLMNSLEGVTCNSIDGALYAFPKLTVPRKAVEMAQQQNCTTDQYYCMEMLQTSGVVLVPGSGFGQKSGNEIHIRTTFLPLEKDFPEVLQLIKSGHQSFMQKHA